MTMSFGEPSLLKSSVGLYEDNHLLRRSSCASSVAAAGRGT